MATSSSAATDSIDAAFNRFKNTVSTQDAHVFHSTTLADVWEALRATEKKLAQKDESRALRRIEPLLTGIGHYSKAVEVLCNGTPYLPWIWAPVKLFLQIASDHLSAFDKLVEAYKEVADCLPRFDRLAIALNEHPGFHTVLAAFYCDILDFHRRAYKFFRACGWKRFFDSSWGRFDLRFKAILGSLRYHARLVDKEASAYSIADIQDWRETYLTQARQTENDRFNDHFNRVISWLDVRDYTQEDDLHRLEDKCCEGTADWLLHHEKLADWEIRRKACLWIHGIPGSGKSVLFAKLVRHMQTRAQNQIVAYFICSFQSGHIDSASLFFRSVISQIVKQSRNLVGYIYDDMILRGLSPSKASLKKLLLNMLPGTPSARIMVDGLDECDNGALKEIMAVLTSLNGVGMSSTCCNVLVVSRELPGIEKFFHKHPSISLKEEKQAVDEAIKLYVHHEMEGIADDIDDTGTSLHHLTAIENRLIFKADGMFLWVRLMLTTLRDLHSAWELAQAVEDLPTGLDEAYGRILDRFRSDIPRGSFDKATRLFAILAFAERPLTVNETLDGVVLSTHPFEVNAQTKLTERELDRYKPMVELDASGTVKFVHFSAKEFILHQSSGPSLDSRQGLVTIATACVASVSSSLYFADLRADSGTQALNVAMEYHALYRYGASAWLRHLETLAKSQGRSFFDSGSSLLDLVIQLCAYHERLLPTVTRQPAISLELASAVTRAKVFEGVEQLQQLASYLWALETALAERYIPITEATAADLSLFSSVRTGYYQVVDRLLRTDSAQLHPHISASVIDRFRLTHSADAFPCRIPTCSKSQSGFLTEDGRNQHEASHLPRFMCPEAGCPFSSALGFRTNAQLRKHTQRHHTTSGSHFGQLASTSKRKRLEEPDVSPSKSVRLPEQLATVFELERFKSQLGERTPEPLTIDKERLTRPEQLPWPPNMARGEVDRWTRCLNRLWKQVETARDMEAYDDDLWYIQQSELRMRSIGTSIHVLTNDTYNPTQAQQANMKARDQDQQQQNTVPPPAAGGKPDMNAPFGSVIDDQFAATNFDFSLEGGDVLNHFDFDSFLNNDGDGGFGLDANLAFDGLGDDIEEEGGNTNSARRLESSATTLPVPAAALSKHPTRDAQGRESGRKLLLHASPSDLTLH